MLVMTYTKLFTQSNFMTYTFYSFIFLEIETMINNFPFYHKIVDQSNRIIFVLNVFLMLSTFMRVIGGE